MDVSTDSESDLNPDTDFDDCRNADGIWIRNVPAVVTWQDSNGDRFLEGLDLVLTHDADAQKAQVKLQASTRLKKGPAKPSIYLFIKPEQISTVTCAGHEADLHGDAYRQAREKLNTSTYALQFRLRSPATFVVPAEHPYKFFRAGSQAVWKSWKGFARDTLDFSLHFPMKTLPKAQLTSFCEAASARNTLTSLPDDIASLYGGKGGKVVRPHDEDDESSPLKESADFQAEAPPAYEETTIAGPSVSGAAPPLCLSPPREPAQSRKRRRASSAESASIPSEKGYNVNDMILQSLSKLQQTINDDKKAQAVILADILAKVGTIEQRISRLEEKQQSLAQEVETQVETQVEPLWDELSARLQSQEDREHDYIRDTVDEVFDEKLDSVMPAAVDQYFRTADEGQSLLSEIVGDRIQDETRDFLRARQFTGHFTLVDDE